MASVSALKPRDGTPLATGNALELSGVSRRFGALRALDDVSLAVAAGERRAVIGANGAGKTTLFNVITGDFPATAGSVRFFGDDVTTMPPYERIRAGLRRTYQSSLLFRDLTVRDNLFLAVRGVARGRMSLLRPRSSSSTRRAADDLLQRVRLTAVADEPVAALSHGQQRQLEIGMALAGAPRLILFDEPAAGLSPSRAARPRRAAEGTAAAHGLRADRARSRDRAQRRRSRDRAAQRPTAEGRHAGRDPERRRGAGDLHGRPALMRWFARRTADGGTGHKGPALVVDKLDVYYGRAHALQEVSLTLEARRARRGWP